MKWYHHLLLYSLFIFFLGSQLLHQDIISRENGLGWDGAVYGEMSCQFWAGVPVKAEAPFCYRLGTPWLASHFPTLISLTGSFLLTNLGALLLLPVVWLRWFRLRGQGAVAGWFWFWIMALSWHSPVRIIFFYPATVDPWMWVFLLLLLPELEHPRLSLPGYLLLTALGVFFREYVLSVPAAAVLAALWSAAPGPGSTLRGLWRETSFRRSVAALAAGAVALAATHFLVTPTGNYSFLRAAVGWFYAKPFPVWIHGWFGAFGLLLLPLMLDGEWCRDWCRQHRPLAWWLGVTWLLAWNGGADTIRIFFWTAPVAFSLLQEHLVIRRQFYGPGTCCCCCFWFRCCPSAGLRPFPTNGRARSGALFRSLFPRGRGSPFSTWNRSTHRTG